MLARLSDTSSSINFMRLEKEHQLTQRLKSNLKRPRPISGMSTKRTANMRPNSARWYQQLYDPPLLVIDILFLLAFMLAFIIFQGFHIWWEYMPFENILQTFAL
jgi:hypothetical protein